MTKTSWTLGLGLGALLAVAVAGSEARAYTVEAGALGLIGSANRSSSSTTPTVSWSLEGPGPGEGLRHYIGSANAAAGTTSAYFYGSAEANGAYTPSPGTYAFVEETIRVRRDASNSSPYAFPLIGAPEDGRVTVRFSFSGGGSTLSVEQPDAPYPPWIPTQARAIVRAFLDAPSAAKAEGGGNVRVTTGAGGGQVVTGPFGHSRWSASHIELDLLESAFACPTCAINVTVRGRIEAEVYHGQTWPHSAIADAGIQMHVAVEPGYTWDTSNNVFLSQGAYLPPALLPEPGAAGGGLAVTFALAALARGRRTRLTAPAGE